MTDLDEANKTIQSLREELKQKDERIEQLEQDNKKLEADVDLLTKRVESLHQETFKYQEKVIELIDDDSETETK
jgi:chromosome segregation ATPase